MFDNIHSLLLDGKVEDIETPFKFHSSNLMDRNSQAVESCLVVVSNSKDQPLKACEVLSGNVRGPSSDSKVHVVCCLV